jgi:hypothetical protein
MPQGGEETVVVKYKLQYFNTSTPATTHSMRLLAKLLQ